MDNHILILLDGTSSAGKTALASHLTSSLGNSVVFSFDQFFSRPSNLIRCFLKSKFLRHRFDWVAEIRRFHKEVAFVLTQHDIVIVDTVLENSELRDDLLSRVERDCLVYVQVYCPLEHLEERERTRSDRKKGLARSQFDAVYAYEDYDIRIDSSRFSPDEAANVVLEFLHNKHM